MLTLPVTSKSQIKGMKCSSASYQAQHPLLLQYFGYLAIPAATQALHLTDGLFWGDSQVTSSLSAFSYKMGPSVSSSLPFFLSAQVMLLFSANAGSFVPIVFLREHKRALVFPSSWPQRPLRCSPMLAVVAVFSKSSIMRKSQCKVYIMSRVFFCLVSIETSYDIQTMQMIICFSVWGFALHSLFAE